MLTTTLAVDFTGSPVLEWYRLRCLLKPVFQRFQSLAEPGWLPQNDDESAGAWLSGMLQAAMLVAKLVGHAIAVPRWGYRLAASTAAQFVA